ncbi:Hypothetical predicted protein [Olea europaea subsp. europaea]|uniref:RING-type E3 ubiquitin transferase n=1 Tax=Olea europaea subsp. europaea TaxID=158383 RepID=A0A8S0PCM4_OLEEU|nr:Hypothetical predicted protein [Olea europaea subsp. europaea]
MSIAHPFQQHKSTAHSKFSIELSFTATAPATVSMVNCHHLLLSPAAEQSPETFAKSSVEELSLPQQKTPVYFSPLLIAMVVVIATAFVIITCWRLLSRHFRKLYRQFQRWRCRHRRSVPSTSARDMESPTYSFILLTLLFTFSLHTDLANQSSKQFLYLSTHERVESMIALFAYIWLRSHAICPLCRAGIFCPQSPFTPLMAARIRPGLEDMIVESTILEPLIDFPMVPDSTSVGEITQEPSSRN